jgi:hypothetical protein
MRHIVFSKTSGALTRRGVAIAAACAALLSTATAGAQRARTEQHVFVTAVNKADAPVVDLAVADLVVREDGLAREIVRVAPAEAEMQVALLLDDSQVATPAAADIRSGASGFVAELLAARPQWPIGVWSFGERPTKVADFTTNPGTLKAGIDRVLPRQGAGAYMLEAVVEAAKALEKRKAVRPVIVAFVIDDGPEFSTQQHEAVRDVLKRAGAQLWTVVLQARAATNLSTEARERAATIADVSTDSGGGSKLIHTQQAIEPALRGLAKWLVGQLDVTYSRPDTMVPPKKREVTVKRDGVRVYAPRWADR